MTHFTLRVDYDKGDLDSYRGMVIDEELDPNDTIPDVMVLSSVPITAEEIADYKARFEEAWKNERPALRSVVFDEAREISVVALLPREIARVFTAHTEVMDTVDKQLQTDWGVMQQVITERKLQPVEDVSIDNFLIEAKLTRQIFEPLPPELPEQPEPQEPQDNPGEIPNQQHEG